MAINIKNPAAERAARELAEATGETLTSAVETALLERLERVRAEGARNGPPSHRAAEIKALAVDTGRRWTSPCTSTDHGDLLYDDAGLPR